MELLPLIPALGVPVLLASLFIWAALRVGDICPCGREYDDDGRCPNCHPKD